MFHIKEFLDRVAKNIAKTVRAFATFIMLVFFAGSLYGFFLGSVGHKIGLPSDWLIALPLILAIFAYYVTEVAFLIFILLIIGFFILLI